MGSSFDFHIIVPFGDFSDRCPNLFERPDDNLLNSEHDQNKRYKKNCRRNRSRTHLFNAHEFSGFLCIPSECQNSIELFPICRMYRISIIKTVTRLLRALRLHRLRNQTFQKRHVSQLWSHLGQNAAILRGGNDCRGIRIFRINNCHQPVLYPVGTHHLKRPQQTLSQQTGNFLIFRRGKFINDLVTPLQRKKNHKESCNAYGCNDRRCQFDKHGVQFLG
ncbi:hypothetical protein XMV225_003132 [Aliiroseovarius sp. xm-v-225]|nr:hypothetical protein [Aliiroseovarius sp. xm-m-314]NRP42812.1 hypothetical protein [Aliiroseovarius sp. xm-m-339-2]NRP45942.1 hypothetical protein [Aliiroseovarius sp. xm-m-378]NRP63695.1 hypothetical protein [Aliiroseovarius sp. xm-a-151]NRP66810.1 hypothetical protein [Aliiroseovarius sp. xm-v-225]NRP81316.1 hypothetical protein [Aliiroseovarius sp. xm-v-209]NRP93874.1 hypothetical protein [Aliiroseovarius sp. xm-a-134]NRQ11798.1 hypothetical protein [Aliiroseovarius sp. xm-v-208]